MLGATWVRTEQPKNKEPNIGLFFFAQNEKLPPGIGFGSFQSGDEKIFRRYIYHGEKHQ